MEFAPALLSHSIAHVGIFSPVESKHLPVSWYLISVSLSLVSGGAPAVLLILPLPATGELPVRPRSPDNLFSRVSLEDLLIGGRPVPSSSSSPPPPFSGFSSHKLGTEFSFQERSDRKAGPSGDPRTTRQSFVFH